MGIVESLTLALARFFKFWKKRSDQRCGCSRGEFTNAHEISLPEQIALYLPFFCFYKANCKNREELRYFAADTERKSEIRRKNIRFEKYEKFKSDENDQEGYEKHEIVEGKKLSGRQFSNVLSCKSDPAAELIEPRAKLQGLKSPPHEFIPNTLLKGVRTPPNAQKFT